MLSRLLFPEPKSEHRDEAVHSALLPTGMGVRVDPRESGRQALLVKICPQENTRESASRRQRERASGRAARTSDRAAGRAVRSRPDAGSRRANERAGAGPRRANERPDGSSAQRRRPVSCGWIHCEIRCWIVVDPPAGDTSPQTGNTSNDKSVKVSTSYFKIEVSWR